MTVDRYTNKDALGSVRELLELLEVMANRWQVEAMRQLLRELEA